MAAATAPGFGECVGNDGDPLDDGSYQYIATDGDGDESAAGGFVVGAARVDQRFVNNGATPDLRHPHRPEHQPVLRGLRVRLARSPPKSQVTLPVADVRQDVETTACDGGDVVASFDFAPRSRRDPGGLRADAATCSCGHRRRSTGDDRWSGARGTDHECPGHERSTERRHDTIDALSAENRTFPPPERVQARRARHRHLPVRRGGRGRRGLLGRARRPSWSTGRRSGTRSASGSCRSPSGSSAASSTSPTTASTATSTPAAATRSPSTARASPATPARSPTPSCSTRCSASPTC